MSTFFASLKEGRVLISDGAWGTFLQASGLLPGECPELWNLSHRDEVAAIARSYVEVGADMILTNSFGANPARLSHYGEEDKCFELNRAAAEISRSEAGESVFVAGSMGPSGAMLAAGEITEEVLYDGFLRQAEGLASGGVQALCVETMSDPIEAALAVRAGREATDLPVFCTYTFKKMPSGEYRTMTGARVEEAVSAAKTAGAGVIGTNCGNGFSQMIEIVKEIRSFDGNTPILVHANAGIPVYRDGMTVYPEGPQTMALRVGELVSAGANIIGGCCGTGPEHIRALIKAIRG
jgi:5-methyltetrahydrofolate--homocysteine methyltransferase